MSESFDIVALAKAINRRRLELRHLHRDVTITPAMSRILENDPDYISYRKRKESRVVRRAKVPAISTLISIAALLGTTVGDLLGERAYRITRADRERVRTFIRFLSQLFELEE